VPQSLIDAYKWYAIAAAKGDVESRTRVDVLASQLGADERAAAEKAAADFRPQPETPAANTLPNAARLMGS
jgi:localization factor PodJL